MPHETKMAGLLGMLGGTSSKQASTLLRLGTAGVIRELTREADKRLEERGGSLLTRAMNRSTRQAAAAMRRQAGRGGMLRSVSRSVGKSARPSAVQRRNMRRESYRRQGERLSDEQLLGISPSELPPGMVRRRNEAAARAQATGQPVAGAQQNAPAADPQRKKIDQQLRDIIGDPDKLPPHVRAQLEQQIADKFAQPAAESGSAEPSGSKPPPQPTAAQRTQENTQAVIDAQLEDRRQPRMRRDEGGGWLDKLQAGLDVVGVADPTPIADGANAAISLGRAAADPERRTEHLQNAAISTVSAIVPYVGDSAKLLKVGRAARNAHAARGAERAAVGATGAAGAATRAGSETAQQAAGGAQSANRGQLRRRARRMGHGIADMLTGGGRSQPPGGDDQREGAPPVFGRGDGAGGAQPPRFGDPSQTPDDDGDSPRRRREKAEGLAAHDKWTDKLKDGALSMASFAGKAYLAVEGLQLFNAGVLAINRDLRQYSGTLAGSYAKADNADIRRDMRKAKVLAKPLSHLQRESSKLEDTMSELITPVHAVLIEILAAITGGVNMTLEVAKAMNPQFALAIELLRKIALMKEEDAPGGRQLMQDLSDGKFDGFGLDELGKRFELLDQATRQQMGLGGAIPRPPGRGRTP